MKYTIHPYKDKNKESRWRMKASNGRIVAESGEGYKRESTMLKMLKKIFEGQITIQNGK